MNRNIVAMEVASSDYAGLVLIADGFGRGVEAQISFLCGKDVSKSNLPRVSQGANIL